jgi:murein DD-endopeptidase
MRGMRGIGRWGGRGFAALLLLLLGGCGTAPERPARVETRIQPPAPGHPVVQTARSLLGIPYRWGGESPDQGFDCSGLVLYAYSRSGVRLPRTAREQYRFLDPVPPTRVLPGDLLFFRIPKNRGLHVGIYVGQDLFIHAPSTGKRVSYASLSNPYWRGSFIGGGRVSETLSRSS